MPSEKWCCPCGCSAAWQELAAAAGRAAIDNAVPGFEGLPARQGAADTEAAVSSRVAANSRAADIQVEAECRNGFDRRVVQCPDSDAGDNPGALDIQMELSPRKTHGGTCPQTCGPRWAGIQSGSRIRCGIQAGHTPVEGNSAGDKQAERAAKNKAASNPAEYTREAADNCIRGPVGPGLKQ